VHDGDIAFAVEDAGGVAGGVVLVGGDVAFGILGVEDVLLGVLQFAGALAEGVGGAGDEPVVAVLVVFDSGGAGDGGAFFDKAIEVVVTPSGGVGLSPWK